MLWLLMHLLRPLKMLLPYAQRRLMMNQPPFELVPPKWHSLT
jgi:hypothetical protein